jgi:hypothetical protein
MIRARRSGRGHRSDRRDQGQASLEVAALIPVIFLGASLALQAGAAMWAMSSVDEATRQAARASSLGYDPRTAAENALPGALNVTQLSTFGPGHGVRLTVDVPRVSPLPQFKITRQVEMP